MRVLHSPVNVANQPWFLSREERRYGMRSDLITNYSTRFKFPADRCLSGLGERTLRIIAKRTWTALAATLKYQILHCYFGRSLLCWDDYGRPNCLWYKDLKIARFLRRKIFMTLQGCDVRMAVKSDMNNEITPCREGICQSYPVCRDWLDGHRQYMVNEILPLCSKVFFLNPDLSHFVPEGTFLPYACVDVDSIEPVPPGNTKEITILHAPTDSFIKGTHFITRTMDKLKKKFPINFRLIQNLTHEDAFKLYRTADIVIDQLLCGWYGGFAVEAMAMGKPVVCYMRESDLSSIPAPMREEIPVLSARPDNLEERLTEILEQRGRWQEWSERSVSYVRKWHNPKHIAKAMIESYISKESHFDLEKVVENI